MYSTRELSPPDIVLPQGPTDSVSSLLYNPAGSLLTACSWDGSLYVYASNGGTGPENLVLKTSFPNSNGSPILCSVFSNDGSLLFTGSADGKLRVFNVNTFSTTEIPAHFSAISCMTFTQNNLLVTGGWDKMVKFWDIGRQQTPISEKQMEERVYALDSKNNVIVACLASNIISVFDIYTFELKKPPQNEYSRSRYMDSKFGRGNMPMPYDRSEDRFSTKLSWQIRAVACTNTGSAAIMGSIDSRVDIISLQHMSGVSQSEFYAFRCHKTDKELFPINKILVHPTFDSIFATCGGDGIYNFWKRSSKYRSKHGGPGEGKSITTAAFDATGRYFAYATGYDWSRGYEPRVSIPVEIRIAVTTDKDYK